MTTEPLLPTRRALHGVAELVIAGPQYRDHGTIRMRIVLGGFAGIVSGVRVEGTDLVAGAHSAPIAGTARQLADALGIGAGAPADLYDDSSGVDVDEPLAVDAGAAAEIAAWFATGDAALRATFPDVEPVLWPEHFDLAVAVDGVNYGVSPGDGEHSAPYAYVGPPSTPSGPFWNARFGALRPAIDLVDTGAVAAFFETGRAGLD